MVAASEPFFPVVCTRVDADVCCRKRRKCYRTVSAMKGDKSRDEYDCQCVAATTADMHAPGLSHVYICVYWCVCECVKAMRHRHKLGRGAHTTSSVCVVVVLLLACLVHECRTKSCPNVALSTTAGVRRMEQLHCHEYLSAQGVAELFQPSMNAEPWPRCSELQPDAGNLFALHKCYCSPGFTDAVYGSNGLGLLEGLRNIDIGRISCQAPCPAAHQSIARLADTGACACWNRRGCVFEERTLLRLIPQEQRVQQSVVVLQDNLQYDSAVVSCRQHVCSQSLSAHDIMLCAQLHIEFTYCDECPAECLQQHRSCDIDATTRFCTVSCDSGYLRVYDSDTATYGCEAVKTCPPHHYNNVTTVHTGGMLFVQSCVACPLGQDNADAYHRGCLPCASGKINAAVGTACTFCPENSISPSDGIAPCHSCPSVPVDKIVRQGATDCSDVVCRPITATFASNCLPAETMLRRSACTRSGFGWTTAGGCEMCPLNHISVTHGSIAAADLHRRCDPCPAHEYTADVGMTHCMSCPDYTMRELSQSYCAVCPPGMFVHSQQYKINTRTRVY